MRPTLAVSYSENTKLSAQEIPGVEQNTCKTVRFHVTCNRSLNLDSCKNSSKNRDTIKSLVHNRTRQAFREITPTCIVIGKPASGRSGVDRDRGTGREHILAQKRNKT